MGLLERRSAVVGEQMDLPVVPASTASGALRASGGEWLDDGVANRDAVRTEGIRIYATH